MRSKLIIIFLLFAGGRQVLSFQFSSEADTTVAKHELSLGLGAIVSYQDQLPFWLQANNSARFNSTNNLGSYSQIHLQKTTNESKSLDYFYHLEGFAFAGSSSQINLIQAYMGVHFKQLRLSIGKQEERFGLNDSTLSIGNLSYGNNASPLPKIVLATRHWTRSPVLSNIFSFRFYFAHGWFEGDRYQSGAMLHQKSLYVRSRFFRKKLSIITGLNHSAQWGGRNLSSETVQPTGLLNFAKIFLASSGGSDALQTDQLNALGNHLGSFDLSAGFKFRSFEVRNYWQFLWEDRSGLTPFNWRDGLVGLSIKLENKQSFISGVNVEVIRTNGQDAVKVDDEGNSFVEPDNFFNNSVYRSGWTYQNRVIGNPIFLLLSPESVGGNRIKNMINGLNVGLEGKYNNVSYRVNYRSFKNQGTYQERFDPPLHLNAIVMSLSIEALGGRFDLSNSVEWGNYPSGNAGVMIGYSRKLELN